MPGYYILKSQARGKVSRRYEACIILSEAGRRRKWMGWFGYFIKIIYLGYGVFESRGSEISL